MDYPDNKIFRDVIAQHYDAIRKDDDLIGDILRALKQSGLDENTIVVYFSDHGANNLLRHKQMTTEGGLRVPLVMMGPEEYVPKGVVRTDLVNMLDLTATTLAWASLDQPSWYEGKDLFAKDFEERKFVGGQKDRLDHTIDRVRTIRSIISWTEFCYSHNIETKCLTQKIFISFINLGIFPKSWPKFILVNDSQKNFTKFQKTLK